MSSAWAFAQRGHQVTIYEQTAPLNGASGNPLALLNPKLCPIEQAPQHLMTLAWQHAMRHYAQFQAFRPIQVNQIALKNPEDLLKLAQDYPQGLLTAAPEQQLTECAILRLNTAAAISPQQLRDEILAHPHIQIKIAQVSQIRDEAKPCLYMYKDYLGQFDHVIVCTALNNQKFFVDYPVLKPIRGQVSWLNNSTYPLALDQAYSYGGYCMQLDSQQLILGASFYPNRDDSEVLTEDHQHNLNLLETVFPEYAKTLAPTATWQGRASVRAQSLDYFPLVGRMQNNSQIYGLAGLGSKGFLFAPLCSEILVAQILAQACPVPENLLQKLSPQRFLKKVKVKKPYFKPQTPSE